MDYSENVKASLATDIAYARWYAQQSDKKKAQMMESGYQFAAKHIEQQAIAENPFSNRADIIFLIVTFCVEK